MVFPWKSFHKALTIGTSYILLGISSYNLKSKALILQCSEFLWHWVLGLACTFLHDSIAYPESWQCKLPRLGSCEGHEVHKTKKVFIIKTLGFLIDYSNGKVDREEIIATEKRHSKHNLCILVVDFRERSCGFLLPRN